MRVTLLYFAAARERAGTSSEAIDLPEGATAAAALAAACERHPPLAAVATKLRLAVDQEFAGPSRKLREGSEVALIPPVSGGAGLRRIGPEPLVPERPVEQVTGPDCGAVVSFVGTVREAHAGRPVARLTYSAYRPMAERRLGALAEELEERHGVRLAVVHRLGTLLPGEASVAIFAASPHREAAFAATRECLERLKREVPVWKREHYADGSARWREDEPLREPAKPAEPAVSIGP